MAAGTRELAFMMTGSGCEAEQTPESEEFARLLKRAKAGDTSAFRQIIVQHQRQVLMTALRLLGRLELAQDAAQEVFLRLHKYLHRYNEAREFSPWLYQVTVNVCRDINRHRRKNSMLSLEELQYSGALGEAVDPIDLEAVVSRAEERRIIKELRN